jgi:CheY-like chemotaxis protein
VLVVEDNVVNQQLALNLLQRWGHAATLAEDGRQALECLARQQFDLVLMDMQMPVMGGLEATRRFRQQEAPGSHLPIIAMTANALQGDREQCLAAGMDDYLSKPVRAADLQQLLQRHGKSAPSAFNYQAALAQQDAEIIDIVADSFLASFPVEMAQLEQALQQADRATLKRLAHTIKGNAALFGATPIVTAAAQLEKWPPKPTCPASNHCWTCSSSNLSCSRQHCKPGSNCSSKPPDTAPRQPSGSTGITTPPCPQHASVRQYLQCRCSPADPAG